VGRHIQVNMRESQIFGPFDSVFCESKGNNYKIIAEKDKDGEYYTYFFQPKRIKYYGELKEDNISGNVNDGMRIEGNPVYVFVNSSPSDGGSPRVEIDFS
jgi:hypothetical protein